MNFKKCEFLDKTMSGLFACAFMVDLTCESKAVYQGQRRTMRVKW